MEIVHDTSKYGLIIDKLAEIFSRSGNPFVIETTVATAGSSNNHDVNAALGINASFGSLSCDGTGNLLVKFSSDGTTFTATNSTVRNGETLRFNFNDIDTLRIDASVSGTAYRLILW